MTESAKSTSPSGIIPGPSYSEIFNSPSFLRTKRKALAHVPMLRRHVPKAPPSPNSGPQAVAAVTKKSQFFADKVKPGKVAVRTPATAQKKPAVAKKAAAPRNQEEVFANYFASPYSRKMRRKALTLGKLEDSHVPKAPPASMGGKVKVAKAPTPAKSHGKKPKVVAQPGLTAAYVYTPGHGIQFQPAKVVKTRAQASELLREGQVGLFSAIAYCDPKGQTHTGTLVEIFSMLPV